jgi:DNA repair protein RecO (recombination protein O)
MLDLTTRAIILDKENVGEFNTRIFLYTEKLGSVVAYATATRKITSKLAAHLEPLTIVDVRLLEKRNHSFQIGDALIVVNPLNLKLFPDRALGFSKIISILKESSFIGSPDLETWELFLDMLTSENEGAISQYIVKFLTVLGFNPKHASCVRCASLEPKYFLVQDFYFYCSACIPRLDSLILEMH